MNNNNEKMEVTVPQNTHQTVVSCDIMQHPSLYESIQEYVANPDSEPLRKKVVHTLIARMDQPIEDPPSMALFAKLLHIADDQMMYWIIYRREHQIDRWDLHTPLPNLISTPLEIAVSRSSAGLYDFAEFLLKNGVNPNQPNPSGFTPIQIAVPQMIGLLIRAGADPFLPDPISHKSVLDEFENWMYDDTRKEMLHVMKGRDEINTTHTNTQSTWLVWLVSKLSTLTTLGQYFQWHKAVMDMLVYDPEVNIQDPHTGDTALHVLLRHYPDAGENYYLDSIIAALLRMGARIDIENNKRRTAKRMIDRSPNEELKTKIQRVMVCRVPSSSSSSSSSVLGKRPATNGGKRTTRRKRRTKRTTRKDKRRL